MTWPTLKGCRAFMVMWRVLKHCSLMKNLGPDSWTKVKIERWREEKQIQKKQPAVRDYGPPICLLLVSVEEMEKSTEWYKCVLETIKPMCLFHLTWCIISGVSWQKRLTYSSRSMALAVSEIVDDSVLHLLRRPCSLFRSFNGGSGLEENVLLIMT